LDRFFSNVLSYFPRITFSNICEIIIIAYLVYEILLWIKNSRAWVLLQGLVIILVFTAAAAIFHFDTILWIAGKIAAIAVTALVVIFQPELRRALEQLGSSNLLSFMFINANGAGAFTEKTVEELVKAAQELSKAKTGALMVIERAESLKSIEETGIDIDAVITNQLIINIFEHNTPLHDGAVVIRGNRISSATCYLPLSENMNISKELGTRHRAAIGISEVTDSFTIVVSEETGNISVAQEGKITKLKDAQELGEILRRLYDVSAREKVFFLWKGVTKNEKKAD
jgi:TIGR00159 family protein